MGTSVSPCWVVDYAALKPVWPCFFDSDEAWGRGLHSSTSQLNVSRV
jgi:hypothetical protein